MVVVLVGGGVLTTVAISVAVAVTFGFAPTAAALRVASSSNRAQRRRHISHNQKRGYRDSYLKRHHRIIIIIISRIQKGEILLTLYSILIGRGGVVSQKKRVLLFSQKKKFRVSESRRFRYILYIYIERERERVKGMTM